VDYIILVDNMSLSRFPRVCRAAWAPALLFIV